MKINKYNIDWQIVRFQAKAIKDVEKKLEFVLQWYKQYPSQQNFYRLQKWLKMSPLGYKLQSVKQLYFEALVDLELTGYKGSLEDTDNYDFDKYEISQLKGLLKDLKKRKYNFQYSGAPKDHYDFVFELEKHLSDGR